MDRGQRYVMKDILRTFLETVEQEGMLYENNRAIIICSSELEAAIGTKYLHLSQVGTIIKRHMENLEWTISLDDDDQE